jgi:hypothetical protein
MPCAAAQGSYWMLYSKLEAPYHFVQQHGLCEKFQQLTNDALARTTEYTAAAGVQVLDMLRAHTEMTPENFKRLIPQLQQPPSLPLQS